MSKRKQIEFEKSSIKYLDDLKNILSNQAIACDLTYVGEGVKEHNARLKCVGRKVVAFKLDSETVFRFISFVFIIALTLSGFFVDGDPSGRAFTMIMTLGLLFPLFLLSWAIDKLGLMDNITRFEETNDGMYITATAQIRTNTKNKKSTSYRQSKDNIPIKIYIQRGLYSDEFRHCCRRCFYVTDYITRDVQNEDKLPGAIMEINPWDILPYPELLKADSPKLDNCQVFYCQDENQPLKYRLSQFYKNEAGQVFYIQYMKLQSDNGNLENLLEDNLAKELSKTREKRWGKYYADRYMQGYIDWNGKLGEAKVTYLKGIKVKKIANMKVRITYVSPNGMKRRLKVPDVFGELDMLK